MTAYHLSSTLEDLAEYHAHSGIIAFQVSDKVWRRLRNVQTITVPSTGRVIRLRGGLKGNYIRPIYPRTEAGECPGSQRPDPAIGTDAGGDMAEGGGK